MRRLAPVVAALALAGCAQPPETPAQPPLWRVEDGDTTIWLLGSIHALPPGVRWETPAVAQTLREADTLILEIPPADKQAGASRFRALATATGLPPLRARIAPGSRALLDRALVASGQSAATLDGFKTWAAALAITAGAGQARGATAAAGLEAAIAPRFAGKAIGALESLDGQLAMFDRLPEPAQRTLLLQAARDAVRGDDPTFDAWRRGDEHALAATLAPLADQLELERTLADNRNARWSTAIVRRLGMPGRVLVLVGAGHLVGPGSVVARLRARGLRVTRVG